MSNASNLSNLANVLDDANAGEFLKSTGSGGVAFDTVAAGAVVYATADLLPLSGFAAGDMAYVTATNRFYINNGSGWYSISLVNTNPNITSVADASSGTTPFTLATDGTATVITVTAADPEEVPLTYGYSVTSGSLNGSTVAQGTGSNTNVFTVTPHASQDATFTITFTASDGINQATSANAFSLSFVTIVTDSNHTTLLATATGTSDNNDITYIDGSGNTQNATVSGDPYAGTFSPYRSGGYSTYFDGSGDWLELTGTALGNGNFTVEAWVWLDSLKDYNVIYDDRATGSSATGLALGVTATGAPYLYTNNGFQITSSQTCTAKKWHHISLVRSSGVITLYLDGTSGGTYSSSANFTNTNLGIGVARTYTVTSQFSGYMRDVRAVVGTAITPPSGGPTERLEAVTNTSLLTCHLPYISDGSTNDHSITINGDPETKPFSPYDYEEYNAADHGGSVYFDGTNDYLDAGDIQFGANDFTIEGWFNFSSSSNQCLIGRFHNFSSNQCWELIYENSSLRFQTNTGSFNNGSVSWTPVINVWYHIAAVRSGSNKYLFINGELQSGYPINIGTGALQGESTGTVKIGTRHDLSKDFNGFMSDIRFVTGTGVYTSDFTPPSAPLSVVTNTSLLIKGTDASIIDKSQGANLKLVGNTTGSTDEVRTGNWANTKTMKFDGNSDYLTFPHRQELNFASNDWTIECWIYPKTNVGYCGIWHQSASGTDWNSIYLNGSFNPKFVFYNSSNNVEWAGTAASNTAPQNTWTHLALVRKFGTGVYLFAGGTLVASDTNDTSVTMLDKTYDHVIGYERFVGNGTYFDGYIQDFRITNGLARYIDAQNPTANFTPPTASLEG